VSKWDVHWRLSVLDYSRRRIRAIWPGTLTSCPLRRASSLGTSGLRLLSSPASLRSLSCQLRRPTEQSILLAMFVTPPGISVPALRGHSVVVPECAAAVEGQSWGEGPKLQWCCGRAALELVEPACQGVALLDLGPCRSAPTSLPRRFSVLHAPEAHPSQCSRTTKSALTDAFCRFDGRVSFSAAAPAAALRFASRSISLKTRSRIRYKAGRGILHREN
jgi:hypothetical protein